ncbi:MAG: serine/threonine-protein kinase, partial [Planctomycetota bacterium]
GPGGSGSGSGRHASQRVPAERKRSGPRAVPAEEEVGAGGAEADAIVGSALESAAAVTEAATKAFPEPPRRDVGARTVAGASLDAVSGHDIRFGELARLERFATAEQVTEALRIQERLLQDGRRRKIGKIMVKLGYLTTIQAKYILRLQRTEDPITGYKLLERRGQGGMGVVYRAVQKSLKREVALKILAPRFATQKRFLQRFLREAKLAGELNHTNLVSAIDFGESNGYYYIAMEYVDGWSVSEMLQEDGPFDEEEALKILIQVARGLEHASEKHIVHRDVKPENILVTPDGVAKLTDLGLSKQLTSDCSITVEGKTLGTPFYVSPELARGTKGVDVRSDLYSLGCTVYHMLAGEPPFTGDNAAAVMACHIAEDPRPLRKLAPDGSRPVQRLIQRLMEKDPDDRYQTPQELVSDIVAIQRGRNPFATRSIGEGGSGRLTPVRGTGRHAAVTSRRFAVPKSLEDRDRRSGGAAPANNSAVIVLLVVFILGGLLLTVVVSQLRRERDAIALAGESNPDAPNPRLSEARLKATETDIDRLLESENYSEALQRARGLAEQTVGTSLNERARDLHEDVKGRVDAATRKLLAEAREALRKQKPGFAIELLNDVPEVGDPSLRLEIQQLRAEARRMSDR